MGPLVKLVGCDRGRAHQRYIQDHKGQPARLRHLPRQKQAEDEYGKRQNADVSDRRDEIVSANISRVNVVEAKRLDQTGPHHRRVLRAISVGSPVDHSRHEVASQYTDRNRERYQPMEFELVKKGDGPVNIQDKQHREDVGRRMFQNGMQRPRVLFDAAITGRPIVLEETLVSNRS